MLACKSFFLVVEVMGFGSLDSEGSSKRVNVNEIWYTPKIEKGLNNAFLYFFFPYLMIFSAFSNIVLLSEKSSNLTKIWWKQWICTLINAMEHLKKEEKNPILSATARIHHYIVLGGKGNWVNLERRQPATIAIYVDR